MWFRFSKPDYFYVGRYRLVDAGDRSPFNCGWSQGFGFFVLHCRWNDGRDESSDGIHYPARKPVALNVNGRLVMWSDCWLSYAEILKLANQRTGATVVWKDQFNRKGTMHAASDPIIATNGMEIDAVMTGNA